MKKIYSKFTKDRKKEFRIETFLAEEKGQRVIAKRALSPESVAHVTKMQRFYEKHRDANVFCPCAMQSEDTIAFAFLKGTSLCKEMLYDLTIEDGHAFAARLSAYGGILEQSADVAPMEGSEIAADPEFVKIFGKQPLQGTMDAARELDMDLTFDNIINDEKAGGYRIIDYEWAFDCAIPVKYVIWRALFAFHFKYAAVMKDRITVEELYENYHISEDERKIFEDMNAHFDAYVYGASHTQLDKYKKKVYPVKALLPKENIFLQVYADVGEGYCEELCVTRAESVTAVDETVQIFTDSGADDTVKSEEDPEAIITSASIQALRIDPINTSGILRNIRVEVLLSEESKADPAAETGDEEAENKTEETGGKADVRERIVVRREVNDYDHNAMIAENGDYIFLTEDPQLILNNTPGETIVGVQVTFEVVQIGVGEEMIRRCLEDCQKRLIEQLAQTTQALEDSNHELELIRQSRIYHTMLESKIDKLMGRS